MSAPLPHRPWWRDDVTLAWRTDSTICVGDGARRAIVNDVSPDLVCWLRELRGQWTLVEAIGEAESRGLGRRDPRRLLRSVSTTGGLDDASVASTAWREADHALRDRLSIERAATRHIHGSPQRADAAMAARLQAVVAISGVGSVADAVAAILTEAGVGSIVPMDRVRSNSRKGRRHAREISCQVLCEATHADAAFDSESLALDIPHLPISVHGARAIVGPLVVPGRTSCLRCRDLHRADADRQWPRIAVQLEQGPRPVTPVVLVQTAAAWAALQVLTLIDLGAPGVTTAGLEWTLTLPHGDTTMMARPFHPLCGCRWWAA